MHPRNAPCLEAAGVDGCSLANNHVLDWGRAGLGESLAVLARLGIPHAGAGGDLAEAAAPSVIEAGGKGRIVLLALASPDSGVPPDWAATNERSGLDFLADYADDEIRRIATGVRNVKRDRDVVVASIHWGGNWGYDVAEEHRRFAHRLIDEAGVDVVHGHSSHHPKAIEIHRGRPILYGCGDFLNDYEGIEGHDSYRSELVLMYLVTMDPASGLAGFEMVPFRIRRFRLNAVADEEAEWLADRMHRECARFGGRVTLNAAGHLQLTGPEPAP